jgi:hypothetical protein
VNNRSIPLTYNETKIIDLSGKHSITLLPSLSPYTDGQRDKMTEKRMNPGWAG